MEWLAQALVQHGFIVAAVDHWGNTYDNKIPTEFLKPWERPLDIRFALTELLRDPGFKHAIDPQRMGAAGFSYGGYTVLALAGGVLDYQALLAYYSTIGRRQLVPPELPELARYLNDSSLLAAGKRVPPLKDPRLKAFFAIAPALGLGFVTRQQFAQVNQPVYLVGVQSDSVAPVKSGARHLQQLLAGAQYFEFPGTTGHYVMLSEATSEIRKSAPVYFADDESVSRHRVHAQTAGLAIRFFNQQLSKSGSAEKKRWAVDAFPQGLPGGRRREVGGRNEVPHGRTSKRVGQLGRQPEVFR